MGSWRGARRSGERDSGAHHSKRRLKLPPGTPARALARPRAEGRPAFLPRDATPRRAGGAGGRRHRRLPRQHRAQPRRPPGHPPAGRRLRVLGRRPLRQRGAAAVPGRWRGRQPVAVARRYRRPGREHRRSERPRSAPRPGKACHNAGPGQLRQSAEGPCTSSRRRAPRSSPDRRSGNVQRMRGRAARGDGRCAIDGRRKATGRPAGATVRVRRRSRACRRRRRRRSRATAPDRPRGAANSPGAALSRRAAWPGRPQPAATPSS